MSRGQRFILQGETVDDQATGLVWSRSANPAGWPLFWGEANGDLAGLNQEGHLGFSDWRLPNRRELFSLMNYAQANPALPEGHPFTEVELAWYWSATPYAANPAYAWYVHAEGGRMFYGDKGRSYYVWPVRGQSTVLPVTGGPEPASGVAWPNPRWEARGQTVRDRLGGLTWSKCADLAPGPVSWFRAMELAQEVEAARLATCVAGGCRPSPSWSFWWTRAAPSRPCPAMHPLSRCSPSIGPAPPAASTPTGPWPCTWTRAGWEWA
ncbi:MAG: DUF1566 domain-containing protein [Desulfarculaceae bacterium]|nr:DUF1566 domain-containing protein [Desulfarculaceae bacterium]